MMTSAGLSCEASENAMVCEMQPKRSEMRLRCGMRGCRRWSGAGRRRLERRGGACGRGVAGDRPLAKSSAAGGWAACLVPRDLGEELRGGVGGGGGDEGADTVTSLAASATAAVRSSGRAESQK